MRCKKTAILLLLALPLLNACSQGVYPSSPTLSKLGPNMQEVMESALSGSLNMQPSVKPIEANALSSRNY